MAIHQNQLKHAIPDDITVEWGLTPKQIIQAQQKDRFCKEQNAKILKGSLPNTQSLLHAGWYTHEIYY